MSKPLTDFVKDARIKSGYGGRCKACLRQDNLARRLADPTAHNAKRRVYNRSNPLVILLGAAKYRAQKQGVPFTLTEGDLVMPTHCPVFGCKLNHGNGKVQPDSPTLDKIIPSLGYVPGNVVIVSHLANRIKSNATASMILKVGEFYNELEKRQALLSN